MLKIRLQRIGRRNNPSYRVVVVEAAAAAKKGKPVELLGTYDTKRKTTSLNDERIKYWISQGAQVSDTMHNILIKNGVIEGVKVNVLPKKSPVTKEKESAGAEAEKGDAAQAADDTVSDTAAEESEAPQSDADASPTDTAEAEKADAGGDSEEEKPQSSSPQDTPSAEG